MGQFHIPRQPTTRIELLPGVGLMEVGFALAGAGIGYLIAQAAAYFYPGSYAIYCSIAFGALSFFLVQGEQNSILAILLRQRAFNRTPQRMLFRLGAGSAAERVGDAEPSQLPAVISPNAAPQPAVPARPQMPRRKLGRKKKLPKSTLPKTVQEWLPVVDVADDLIHRRDGRLVAVIQVEPVNLQLRSPREQERLLAVLHEAINSLQQPAQILSLPRPIDLDGYVQMLRNRLREVDRNREHLLRMYTQYVSGLVAGGELQERRFYILLAQSPGPNAPAEVLQRAHDLATRLKQGDLSARVLDDQELFGLLYVWGHPDQAAFERPPAAPPSVTTLMEG